MRKLIWRMIGVLTTVMITFAAASFIVKPFLKPEKPVQDGNIEDWGQICFWPDIDGLYASVSPKGCYSTSCTRPKLQTGTAIVDVQNRKIQLEARFVLQETSRFPLPCTKDCYGGGRIQFKFDQLIPNDYTLWFSEERVGEIHIFSGRTTPRQCFENQPE